MLNKNNTFCVSLNKQHPARTLNTRDKFNNQAKCFGMDYWYSKLKNGGVIFLYLPDYSQEYWRPWNNRKHLNIFTPQIIEDYMIDRGYINIFKSGIDLNNAFMIMGEK